MNVRLSALSTTGRAEAVTSAGGVIDEAIEAARKFGRAIPEARGKLARA